MTSCLAVIFHNSIIALDRSLTRILAHIVKYTQTKSYSKICWDFSFLLAALFTWSMRIASKRSRGKESEEYQNWSKCRASKKHNLPSCLSNILINFSWSELCGKMLSINVSDEDRNERFNSASLQGKGNNLIWMRSVRQAVTLAKRNFQKYATVNFQLSRMGQFKKFGDFW